MNYFQKFLWAMLNMIFISELIGLYFEIVNEGFSWWWLIMGIVLVLLVNISIILDKKQDAKHSKGVGK